MKRLRYILLLIVALLFIGCSDDEEQQYARDIDFCMRAVWQDGLVRGNATRALSATDILADVTSDIVIDDEDYPAVVNVVCKKDDAEIQRFTLTKGKTECFDHIGYWNYVPDFFFSKKKVKDENYDFFFTATIDEDGDPDTKDGDVLEGRADHANIEGYHMLVTLHHTKALLRFAFKLDEDYDKIRRIVVTGIQLNDSPCTLVYKVLNTADQQAIAYAYVDPAVVTTSYNNVIKCTYNIYDRDAVFTSVIDDQPATVGEITAESLAANADHLTREGVTATNQFTLSKVFNGSPVGSILPGYYYDLRVTLNPDYLYVLSEHDNKQHLTIE